MLEASAALDWVDHIPDYSQATQHLPKAQVLFVFPAAEWPWSPEMPFSCLQPSLPPCLPQALSVALQCMTWEQGSNLTCPRALSVGHREPPTTVVWGPEVRSHRPNTEPDPGSVNSLGNVEVHCFLPFLYSKTHTAPSVESITSYGYRAQVPMNTSLIIQLHL